MRQGYENKSTVNEIRDRFENDVERFSNHETGQSAAVDAADCLEMIANCAIQHAPEMKSVLDIGCGAGNFTLRILGKLKQNNVDVTLNDLSANMLERARQRVRKNTSGQITVLQDDIRDIELANDSYDAIVAAMVFHHLREDEQWDDVFASVYQSLKPGGALWIYDLVEHEKTVLHDHAWLQYSDYLVSFKGESYRDTVFDYIAKEDSPRPLMWQLERLLSAGFSSVDVLHKHSTCSAFCAFK
ncbi:class I SAM-dependent methyltransferase [Planctomycetota bacterium]|nr:class I SAM-dependent methyltransferase [Planctomycetota bacterium]